MIRDSNFRDIFADRRANRTNRRNLSNPSTFRAFVAPLFWLLRRLPSPPRDFVCHSDDCCSRPTRVSIKTAAAASASASAGRSSICFSVSDWNSFSVQKGLSESQCFKFIQKAAKTNSSQTGPEQMSLRRKPACSLLVDLFLGYCMECFFHCAVGRVVNSRSIRQRSTRTASVSEQPVQCLLPSSSNQQLLRAAVIRSAWPNHDAGDLPFSFHFHTFN